MGEVVRYGLVGTGMMGVEHINNLAITPGARLVAIADPVERSLGWARKALGDAADGISVYAGAAELAESGDVDAVVVASPNHTHREVLEPLFDAEVHILCEKPLATTVADARWVAEAAASSGRVFWTAMEYRYMPPAAEFIRRVHAGDVGALRMLSIREHRFPFLPKVGDWNRFNRNTGGTMVEKCCHFFDLMRLIVRSEPVRVYCSGAMDVNHVDERYEGERPDIIDNSYTTVDFADGTRAMLDLCMFAEGAENQEEMTAVGNAARLDVFIPDGTLVRSPRTGFMKLKAPERTHVGVDEVALRAGHHHGATFYEHQAFLRAVRGEGPVEVTADDGLRAVAMGMAAEISARERRAVEMSEVL
ncbi:MAG: Oxidoreductase, NAD(P)-dependent, weak similarity to Myo-inositol 2-dehydrogenase [uncultured Sphingomonadaceae bacterium]|uniref:Oxidoreductase, NAD(P)-dependent, weak similarity to Myo-inositol 2-dehydrogenase n=1 Tax=uncultured Sphingomonadaceae bacterium TaxID=169976 RepID=A0A6J4S5X0_9SPHN|nr:MAG: Oxidoreductase, NAD(P)-dependent, weak similarity to Myo-inositol 2-dehydrogenase [uncultured Sphingomonadaceae bacterium]